jgi:hypothetical protein
VCIFVGEKRGEMGLDRCPRLSRRDSKARGEGAHGGVGLHLGGVDVELPSPDQPRLLALLDNRLKEAPKHRETVAGADARQA